ncbi:MAG TPA: VWA domain-containing protein [Thermoanaerobaculia bacterium]|jgi:VWFA-related protein|nr:VWA domain-containing protein [Thermoanaerobaculia bacterium]
MRKLRSGGLAVVTLLAALLPLASTPANAQPPQAPPANPPQSVFGEQIDVRVVNVEVVVTDKQGNRVAGFTPDDFRLKVDGKVVPVEYFNEVRGGSAIALAESAASSVKGLPSLAPGSPVGTSYLVFVDNFFSLANRRDGVLRSLKDQLSRLGPDDRMAIVAFDGRNVEMLSSWSNSVRQLGSAIEKAIGEPAQGLGRVAELRSFDSSRRLIGGSAFEPGPRASFTQRLNIEEIEYADRLASQAEREVSAAVSTLRGFASPPGRKVMLLLSGGWPFSPADYVVNNPNRPILDRDVPRGDEIFRPLADTANRLGYTIYPMDVPGIEGTVTDASQSSPSPTGLNIREQEHEATLQWVAQQTGGRALLNSLANDALNSAESDTRSYYWLGFTPSWQGNDKRHKVEVTVTHPGFKVRYREDFLDLSRKAEVSMQVESAMMFGNGPDSAPLLIKLGQSAASGRREMELPITLGIPAEALTFVPVNGKYTAEVELRVSAVDSGGARAPVPVIPITITTATSPKPGAVIKYDTKLKLRKLPHHLTLAVFDPQSGKILLAQTDVTVPPK